MKLTWIALSTLSIQGFAWYLYFMARDYIMKFRRNYEKDTRDFGQEGNKRLV